MNDVKPKFANFPERDLKVLIGPNINAGTTKTLTRMSIGTYEMSFTQQEKATATAECCRQAINALSKQLGMAAQSTPSRDFVQCLTTQNTEHKFQLWVTTPFEPTQAGHVIWTKYVELGGEGKVGVAFKFATGYTVDDILGVLKKAQDHAVKLGEGEPFTLKGNPPPRFQKKAKPAEAPAAETADAGGDKPAE